MDNTKDRIVEEEEKYKAVSGRRWTLLAVVIAVLCLTMASVAAYFAYITARDQAKRGTNLSAEVIEACQDPLRVSELGDLCPKAEKVVDAAPTSLKGEKGDPGVPGDTGPPPSDADVVNAVALYCASGRCRGKSGTSVTQRDVSEAVAEYCDNRGRCQGPEGAVGTPGPPPSDSQVAAGVAQYCSTRNACEGDKGDTGNKGNTGDTGPSGPAGEPGTPGTVITGGSCNYTGIGGLTVTIQTENGPVQFECAGIGAIP